jgi:predicted MFS family arabinose efflux permease
MTAASPAALSRRLRPLQVAIGLQGMMLWAPVEKLFMTEIGFTPASVGVMAAAYAVVVPLLEVPSGLLADRWSRTGVLMLSTAALALSSLIGWLSHDVVTYVVAALILGVFFALNSGTVDSVVYDTVLEETGSSELYELWIGRVRMVEGAALVVSALIGGALAGWTDARLTYLVTVPVVALGGLALLRFHEPRLHRTDETMTIRTQAALTARSVTGRPEVRRVLALSAMAAMLAQTIFEFGPLWLVALAAPAVLFGPYWAALVSTLGLGGYLAPKVNLDRRAVAVMVASFAVAADVALAMSSSLIVVVVAQTVVALLLAVIGIHAGKLLHDAVPSSVRTGVSSAVGTLSWVVFLPVSLGLGWLARERGIGDAGWVLTALAAIVGALLVSATVRPPALVAVPDVPDDLPCRELVDVVTNYLDQTLTPAWRSRVEEHLDHCGGCAEYVRQVRATIAALESLRGARHS